MSAYRITHYGQDGTVDFDGVFEGTQGDRLAALAIAIPQAWEKGVTLDDDTTIVEVE